MSRKYNFQEPHIPHFVSFATVGWVDLFTRRIYFKVLTDSLDYCIKNKGLIVNAWCIMTNHVHLIIRSDTHQLPDIMRDMKKFTAKELINTITNHVQEGRRKRLLSGFKRAGRINSNNTHYQVWQQHNHPIALTTNQMIDQRLDYLHMNPVKAGFVERPQDWLFSSAKKYAGSQGFLDLEIAV